MSCFQQALSLYRQLELRQGEATALVNLGAIYLSLGDNQKALDYSQQALNLSREIGDKVVEATAIFNIGKIYSDVEDRQPTSNEP